MGDDGRRRRATRGDVGASARHPRHARSAPTRHPLLSARAGVHRRRGRRRAVAIAPGGPPCSAWLQAAGTAGRGAWWSLPAKLRQQEQVTLPGPGEEALTASTTSMPRASALTSRGGSVTAGEGAGSSAAAADPSGGSQPGRPCAVAGCAVVGQRSAGGCRRGRRRAVAIAPGGPPCSAWLQAAGTAGRGAWWSLPAKLRQRAGAPAGAGHVARTRRRSSHGVDDVHAAGQRADLTGRLGHSRGRGRVFGSGRRPERRESARTPMRGRGLRGVGPALG